MMKRFFYLTLVSLLVVCSAASHAFEGIIVQKNTQINSGRNPGLDAMKKMLEQMPAAQRKMMEDQLKAAMGNMPSEPQVSTNTTYIKGSKLRMNFEGQEGEKTYMVMDMNKRVIRNFFPERQAYVEMSLDEVEQMGRGFSNMKRDMGMNTDVQATGELKKTGEKKQIHGYKCEQYTQQVGNYTNEYWLTKEVTMKQIMGGFLDYMKTVGKMGGQNAQHEALMKKDSYPILTVTENEYGTNRSEVVKIEKKDVDGDLFEVPSGYKKQTMREMMNR